MKSAGSSLAAWQAYRDLFAVVQKTQKWSRAQLVDALNEDAKQKNLPKCTYSKRATEYWESAGKRSSAPRGYRVAHLHQWLSEQIRIAGERAHFTAHLAVIAPPAPATRKGNEMPVTSASDFHAAESASKEMSGSKPYEFRALTNDITLDIKDQIGAMVFYTKRSKIRILCDGAYFYVEDMSTDGEQSEFEVSPGVVDSVRKEQGKILIKTTFGHERRKGDEFERTFKCLFRNAFLNNQEYWVQRQVYPTDQFSITVIFPIGRPFRSYHATLLQGTYTCPCPQPTERTISGRQALLWKIVNPKFKDCYKIEWAW